MEESRRERKHREHLARMREKEIRNMEAELRHLQALGSGRWKLQERERAAVLTHMLELDTEK